MSPGEVAEKGRLRIRQILLWQGISVGIGAIVAALLAKGSAISLLLGAGVMHLSMRLSEMALRLSVRRERHPAFAGALFLAKLLLLLGIALIGLSTRWIDPMSLAIGAASLPLAIVLDTCYAAWVNRRAARKPRASRTPPATTRWNIR